MGVIHALPSKAMRTKKPLKKQFLRPLKQRTTLYHTIRSSCARNYLSGWNLAPNCAMYQVNCTSCQVHFLPKLTFRLVISLESHHVREWAVAIARLTNDALIRIPFTSIQFWAMEDVQKTKLPWPKEIQYILNVTDQIGHWVDDLLYMSLPMHRLHRKARILVDIMKELRKIGDFTGFSVVFTRLLVFPEKAELMELLDEYDFPRYFRLILHFKCKEAILPKHNQRIRRSAIHFEFQHHDRLGNKKERKRSIWNSEHHEISTNLFTICQCVYQFFFEFSF